MKGLKLYLVLIILIITSLTACKRLELSGEGSKANPYQISNKTDLINFQEYVNSKKTMNEKYVTLENDIDLGGILWEPIGSQAGFYGMFDGNNHTISNFTIKSSTKNIGFFAMIFNKNSKFESGIKNLNLENVTIKIKDKDIENVGTLAGISHGLIENCNVQANIECNECIGKSMGGIVGYSTNLISNSQFSGSMTLNVNEYHNNKKVSDYWISIGGIIGYSKGDVDNTINNASITMKKLDNKGYTKLVNYQTGGIVGTLDNAKLTNSANTGEIKAVGTLGGVVAYAKNNAMISSNYNIGAISTTSELIADTGGILARGYEQSRIINCFNTGEINVLTIEKYNNTDQSRSFSSVFVGGIMGSGNNDILNSYNLGNITVSGANTHYVGGLAGGADARVINSYNKGNIKVTSTKNTVMAGGIIGVIQTNSSLIEIANCYAAGIVKVRGGSGGNLITYELSGGLWGFNMTPDNTIRYNYYITDVYENLSDRNEWNYPIYHYGEQDAGEAENITSDTIYDNFSIETVTFMNQQIPHWGRFISFADQELNDNNVWIFTNNEYPKLFYQE